MKHYMDIENARFEDVELGEGIVRRSNVGAFKPGDHIVIQEKFDGSCASVQYDIETQKVKAFSRKQELDINNNLAGFFEYVQQLPIEPFTKYPDYVFFGEWGRKNKIVYNKESYGKWYVFDIYDLFEAEYLPQSMVEVICKDIGLTYIHTFYNGAFISWDHVKTFLNDPLYGERQEGCVVKNQDLLFDKENRLPYYIKIVNDDFKESKAPKEADPEKEEAKLKAERLISSIVTENRVRKMIEKLVDEGLIKSELAPSEMKTIAKNLPKRIFDDCIKEEPEIIKAAGEYAGKTCSSITMKIARQLIVG